MVGLTGLEPVTPRLSSACSNQLSYRPIFLLDFFQFLCPTSSSSFSETRWWRHGDSNPGHPACKAGALPTELYPLGRGSRFLFWKGRYARRASFAGRFYSSRFCVLHIFVSVSSKDTHFHHFRAVSVDLNWYFTVLSP